MSDVGRPDEPREQAFAALYEADQRDSGVSADLGTRAERMARGTLDHLHEIDPLIDGAADHWTVDRMPSVDRALLRLATYELSYETHTPTAVILSETVRMAKTYSTQNSARFVNGVLATLAKTLRGTEEIE